MTSIIHHCNPNTKTRQFSLCSIQDGVAADFTSLAKILYDLNKTNESADCKGSPLVELVVDRFDEEQIWQELELQNTIVLTQFEKKIHKAAEEDMLTLIEEIEEGAEDRKEDAAAEELEDGDGEEEEAEEIAAKRLRQKTVKRQDSDLEEDSDFDFNTDEYEKQEQKNKLAVMGRKRFPQQLSDVDDRFFKLSEMESFLDDMDKQEGKEIEGGIDLFQDMASDNEGETFNLEKPISAKKQTKKSSVCIWGSLSIIHHFTLDLV